MVTHSYPGTKERDRERESPKEAGNLSQVFDRALCVSIHSSDSLGQLCEEFTRNLHFTPLLQLHSHMFNTLIQCEILKVDDKHIKLFENYYNKLHCSQRGYGIER